MKPPKEKLITEFLEYLEIERGRSQATIRNYAFYLERFFAFARGKQKGFTVKHITAPLVRQYRLWLNRATDEHGRSLKPSTQNYHLIALRTFLKYLAKHDIDSLVPDKIELAKQSQRHIEYLDGGDLSGFLDMPLNTTEPEIIRYRDKAILELLFSTGLRVSELVNVKKNQINMDKEEFSVRGKGDKPRIVFISQQAKHWLKEYLSRRRDAAGYMFVSHDRAGEKRHTAGDVVGEAEHLTARSVQRLVKKYAALAGITKRITPHTLRHSFATDLLTNGADIRSVQTLLGHSSITTTQVYTHIADQHLKEVYQAFHGKKRKK